MDKELIEGLQAVGLEKRAYRFRYWIRFQWKEKRKIHTWKKSIIG